MKKVLMLAIVYIMTNMIAQNYCNAQAKLKPANCSYFQMVHDDDIQECIWIGSDRKTKLNKWIFLREGDITEFIETSRDEWSIYLKCTERESSGFSMAVDFYKNEVSMNGAMVSGMKIQNQKQEYDYSKLGGAYLKK